MLAQSDPNYLCGTNLEKLRLIRDTLYVVRVGARVSPCPLYRGQSLDPVGHLLPSRGPQRTQPEAKNAAGP